jgi:hypothetical protein
MKNHKVAEIDGVGLFVAEGSAGDELLKEQKRILEAEAFYAKNKKDIDALNQFNGAAFGQLAGSGYYMFFEDKEHLKKLVDGMKDLMKEQNVIVERTVLPHLKRFDAFLFKRIAWFTKLRLGKVFVWYFRDKVELYYFDQRSGHAMHFPGLANFAGVKVYGKKYPFHNMPFHSKI